jgi:hypothetical protein
MSKIYESAACVVVWLGLELAQVKISVTRVASGRQDSGELGVDTLRVIARAPYFSRAWCTQEIVAGREVLPLLNETLWGWSALRSAAFQTAYIQFDSGWKDPNNSPTLFDIGTMWSTLLGSFARRMRTIQALRLMRKRKRTVTLLTLLSETVMCLSQMPEDKIYSLWSLAEDGGHLIPRVDYSIAPTDLFCCFALAWIRKYLRLDILATATIPMRISPTIANESLQTPTWVPDWSGFRLSRPLLAFRADASAAASCQLSFGRGEEEDVVDLPNVEEQTFSSASGPMLPFVLPDEHHKVLIAGGISSDRIDFVSEFYGQSRTSTVTNWLQSMKEPLDTLGSTDRVARVILEDLTHAISAGRDCFRAMALSKCGMHPTVRQESEKFHIDFGEADEKTQMAWKHHFDNVLSGRRLAITRNGHVGFVPGNIQIGFEIAIIFGCCLPLALCASSSGDRRILGDCYFRRMVGGEMIEAVGGPQVCRSRLRVGETPTSDMELLMNLEYPPCTDHEETEKIRARAYAAIKARKSVRPIPAEDIEDYFKRFPGRIRLNLKFKGHGMQTIDLGLEVNLDELLQPPTESGTPEVQYFRIV